MFHECNLCRSLTSLAALSLTFLLFTRRLQQDLPSRAVLEMKIELLNEIGAPHLAHAEELMLPVRFPGAFQLF